MEWLDVILKQILNSLSLVLTQQKQIIALETANNTKLEVIAQELRRDRTELLLIVKQTAPPPQPQPYGFKASLTVDS
jgi:hypothetical protein